MNIAAYSNPSYISYCITICTLGQGKLAIRTSWLDQGSRGRGGGTECKYRIPTAANQPPKGCIPKSSLPIICNAASDLQMGIGAAADHMADGENTAINREDARVAALDENQVAARINLAKYTAVVFERVGIELGLAGHLLGSDRRDGLSPFGHGNDSAVALSMLLRIGSQLVSASADLIADGRHYAGSALIRQLVEVEYLAWAFETKDEEAARWLRSTHEERKSFFTPAKLRAAADKRFRSVDYSYHCELGGHPVPGSWMLLYESAAVAQLMLSDCLGHSGRIWDHAVGWAKGHSLGSPILSRAGDMLERYMEWKKIDKLTVLPQPPDFPSGW
jgi:hypothetical protein